MPTESTSSSCRSTAVWLSPLTEAPDDDFGYAVTDHFDLRGRFGEEAELRALIDWFERDADGTIASYFDWANLKNLDYDNPQVQAYVIAAFAHWLREYEVDGFRVDASRAVRQRAPEFWPRCRSPFPACR